MSDLGDAAPRSRGFTLLEVMIALAVVGIGLVAASSSIAQLTANGVYLRDKTIAHWIAMNKLAELRLAETWPGIGESDDEIEYGGRDWHWSVDVSATDVEALRRIDIEITREGEQRVLAKLAGFVGEARPPGGMPTPWTGFPAGGEGGPGPDDPGDVPPPDEGDDGDTGDDGDDGSGEEDPGAEDTP